MDDLFPLMWNRLQQNEMKLLDAKHGTEQDRRDLHGALRRDCRG